MEIKKAFSKCQTQNKGQGQQIVLEQLTKTATFLTDHNSDLIYFPGIVQVNFLLWCIQFLILNLSKGKWMTETLIGLPKEWDKISTHATG